ncbi:MAG: HaeII family restriction endonuclease [Deltaproteobacteria bacterium]
MLSKKTPITIEEAKARLDMIINIGRVDLYTPIQIAEALRRSRLEKDIDVSKQSSFQNPSFRWRNEITRRLTGKVSTSSARYQHDVWNPTAMPPEILCALDTENKRTKGAVERYIYMRYSERQGTVARILSALETATPKTFQLAALFDLFVTDAGIRRSIDKAYEIVSHSLFETVVAGLSTTIKVSVPAKSKELLKEFADLARVLLGLDKGRLEREEIAHIYRVGVTNAADRGIRYVGKLWPRNPSKTSHS